ncbi:MAG: hypothetical protein ACYS5V_09125, partial [Planctomycetota bacterium]
DTNYASGRPGDDAFTMVTPFSPFHVIDLASGEKRPACDDDVRDGARLYDAFGAIGPVHVHTAEMDQQIAQVHIARLCCESAPAIGNWAPAFNYEQAVCIRDMFLAAGRPEPYVAFQMTHSPLRLDAYFLDILMRARTSANGTRGMTAGGGAMPLPGVSAPIHYRSAAAQGLAEALGAWITVKLIDSAIRPYASFLVGVPDMITCDWSHCAPEALAFTLLTNHVMERLLGITAYVECDNLHSMCLHALHGTRRFNSGGLRDGCFSPAHVPVDREKINFVQAVAEGIGVSDEPGSTARIFAETLPETSFLGHPSSLEYRDLYWHPKVFEGLTPGRAGELLAADSPELLDQAREIAAARIAGHEFELPRDVRRDVERIYRSGVDAILAGPTRGLVS